MSWKPEVIVDATGNWYGNSLRFETEVEAKANADDLRQRWTAVIYARAAESPDPVNYRYIDGKLIAI